MEKNNEQSQGMEDFEEFLRKDRFRKNCELSDLGHDLAKEFVYPTVFNVKHLNELKIVPTALYRDDSCPELKKLDGKRAIDYIVKKSSKAFPQFSQCCWENYVQEKWRDDKYRSFQDVNIGVGNPNTIKGEIFKLQAASHFLFGYVNLEKKIITEWLCIKDITRLVELIHEEEIPFTTYEDENGRLNIYVSIRILKEYNFVCHHYPGDIQ